MNNGLHSLSSGEGPRSSCFTGYSARVVTPRSALESNFTVSLSGSATGRSPWLAHLIVELRRAC